MWFTTFNLPGHAYVRRLHLAWNSCPSAEAGLPVDMTDMRGAHILLLGFDSEGTVDLRSYIRSYGAFVSWSYEAAKLTEDPCGCGGFDTIIINLDAFEDLETGVEALLSFRSAYPAVGIVLVSSRVARDEFGGHRKAICDSTLRYPVTSDRLIESLKVALRHLQGRDAPLHASRPDCSAS